MITTDAFGELWNAAEIAEPEPLQVGRRVTYADALQMAQQEAAQLRAEHAAEIAALQARIAELEAARQRQQSEFEALIAGRTAYISEQYIAGAVCVSGQCTPGPRYVLLTGRQAAQIAGMASKDEQRVDWRGFAK